MYNTRDISLEWNKQKRTEIIITPSHGFKGFIPISTCVKYGSNFS